jgi:hypothetical protein
VPEGAQGDPAEAGWSARTSNVTAVRAGASAAGLPVSGVRPPLPMREAEAAYRVRESLFAPYRPATGPR